ncbi:MAG: hypothetical protein AAB634_01165 [Patescibacteria group bacterium]
MKKIYVEVALAIIFVVASTLVMFRWLSGIAEFWNTQIFWNTTLIICWVIVAFGYYRQGWIVRKAQSASHVSVMLPTVVFIVQCILFVKGIYYNDPALIVGAVMVNCGVVFNLYQIWRVSGKN